MTTTPTPADIDILADAYQITLNSADAYLAAALAHLESNQTGTSADDPGRYPLTPADPVPYPTIPTDRLNRRAQLLAEARSLHDPDDPEVNHEYARGQAELIAYSTGLHGEDPGVLAEHLTDLILRR